MNIDQKLFELSAEITGVSMIIIGLSNQFDNENVDIITPSTMHEALFGISSYLMRIASDLDNIKEK